MTTLQLLGKNCRFLRKKKKLTQRQFAEKIGTPVDRYEKWESGTQPDVQSLINIATEHQVTVDDLLKKDLSL